MKTDLVVTGVGMLTPIGLTANECLHSVRSGITRLTIQPWPDRIKNWLVGGQIMTWVPYERERRLQFLAELAFAQAWSRAEINGNIGQSGPTALLLGGPESIRPGYRFPSAEFNAQQWLRERQVANPGPCEYFPYGACSAQVALQRAHQLFESGAAGSCVIGIADTQWHIRITRWHEDNYRLKCGYLSDGLMPGEAACFLVVEPRQAARARGANILAHIRSTSASKEIASILSDQPNTAKGLTDVVRGALQDSSIYASEIGAVWGDLNGESYRAREWAFTEIRTGFQTHTQLMHPADCHGDLGAASDANLIGIAVMAHASGWANGKPALLFSGSEGGVRAATVVFPPIQKPPVFQVTFRIPRVFSDDFALPPVGNDSEDFRESENPQRTYFEWQLRQEHLEEIASIYEQRKGILSAPDVPWYRAREPEQRLLNHLDAAAAAGGKSLWALASGVVSADEGTSFAGALAFGAVPSRHNLSQLWQLLKDSRDLNIIGLQSGLRYAPIHPHLSEFIAALLTHQTRDLQLMGIYLTGYRRETKALDRLAFLSQSSDTLVCTATINALLRLQRPEYLELVERHLTADYLPLQRSALLAAMVMGSRNAKIVCRNLVSSHDPNSDSFAPFLLSLLGDSADVPLLSAAIQKSNPHPSAIQAAAISGFVELVPHLIELLRGNSSATKSTAAEALELITGAGLRAKAIVVERIDLLDGDFEDVESEVEKIIADYEPWAYWWTNNRHRYNTSFRWRKGAPLCLGSYIDEMGDAATIYKDRQRAYWELTVQSSQFIAFEPDWFVAQQEDALTKWADWWRQKQS